MLVVLAVLLIGRDTSGGDDAGPGSAPSSAPVTATAFCNTFFDLRQTYTAFEDDPGPESVATVRTAAESMRTTAEGFDMPAPARVGLSYFTSLFEDLPPGATPADLLATDEDATLQESANVDALGTFVSRTCYDEPATLGGRQPERQGTEE